MLFRVIRRAPWIALGAAGAYYFDGAHGASRRADATDRIRGLVERGREQWRSALQAASSEDGAVRVDRNGASERSLDPSISSTGVPVPLPDPMAQVVLEGA